MLIGSIQPDSVINSCTIPLKEGDEIIEINKESVLGEAAQAIFFDGRVRYFIYPKIHLFVEIATVVSCFFHAFVLRLYDFHILKRKHKKLYKTVL